MDGLLEVIGVQEGRRYIVYNIYGYMEICQFRRHTGDNAVDQGFQVGILQGQRGGLCTAVNDVQPLIKVLTALTDMGQVPAVLFRNIQKPDFRLNGQQFIFHIMAESLGGCIGGIYSAGKRKAVVIHFPAE